MKFLDVFCFTVIPHGEFHGAFPNGETFPLARAESRQSRNEWATVGITKSFLARPSVGGEQANPAMKALRELQRSLSSQEGQAGQVC
eukprot:symbB.v1.2.022886.t1/scaffold2050.1/size155523/4